MKITKDEKAKKVYPFGQLLVLYLIYPILVPEIMVKPVTNSTLSISVMIWSAFIIFIVLFAVIDVKMFDMLIQYQQQMI